MSFSLDLNLNISDSTMDLPRISSENTYDAIVIGGGPSGLNAALYLSRKGRSVGVISKNVGGQVMDTSSVENYLGIEHASGYELSIRFERHISSLGIPCEFEKEAVKIEKNGSLFTIELDDGAKIATKTIIAASGSKPRKLEVKGESELRGKGVAYCAICDGPLFKGKPVVVAGGGNSAAEAALDLSKIAETVTLVHRSELRADKVLADQLYSVPNIKVMLNTKIEEVCGNKAVEGMKVRDADGSEAFIKADGIFVEIGYLPNSNLFKDIVEINQRGEIVIDRMNMTSEPGIFAAGDVTDTPYKQIIIAAGEGAKAALSVNDYLNKQ